MTDRTEAARKADVARERPKKSEAAEIGLTDAELEAEREAQRRLWPEAK